MLKFMNFWKNEKMKSLNALPNLTGEQKRAKLECELKKIRRAKALHLKSLGVCTLQKVKGVCTLQKN